jgi:hypothetical protein
VVSLDPFPILDVSNWDIVADETSGAEEKYWLQEPETNQRWLFKAVTIKNGQVHGEDWAEKTAAHLADLMGIPCARVELANMRGSCGCISADLRPLSYELQHGQVLLEEQQAPGYVHGMGKSHPGHTPKNIRTCLEGALPPPGCALPFAASAYDVFAGYTVFDAWVANRDRHDNNWAVLRPAVVSDEPLRLCGSYDHASSLGFNVTEVRCAQLVAERRVGVWCQRGTAWRFEYHPDRPIPTLVELAVQALKLASPAAQRYWPDQLRNIGAAQVRDVLGRVSRMSDPARIFAEQVLDVNRRRVLDGCT